MPARKNLFEKVFGVDCNRTSKVVKKFLDLRTDSFRLIGCGARAVKSVIKQLLSGGVRVH